jgi:hypothetical protein
MVPVAPIITGILLLLFLPDIIPFL